MKPNGLYIYLMTAPPHTFIIGKINNEPIIDTHMINTNLGGDGNGVIKLVADERNLRSWVWRRLLESGVKQSMQEFVGVILDPQEAEKSGEENIYTHACNSGIYVEEELSEYVDSVGSDVINDTFSRSFTKPSDLV